MRHIFEQNDKYTCLLAASASAATTSSYVDLSEYGSAAFLCFAYASSNNVVCQVMQATDTSGTSAKTCTNGPQSGTVTLTGDGSTLQYDVIEVTDRDLDVANSFKTVAIRLTPSGTTDCGAWIDRGNCRHAASTMPT